MGGERPPRAPAPPHGERVVPPPRVSDGKEASSSPSKPKARRAYMLLRWLGLCGFECGTCLLAAQALGIAERRMNVPADEPVAQRGEWPATR